jgi:transcriptional regulator with XRE-family HTH domain
LEGVVLAGLDGYTEEDNLEFLRWLRGQKGLRYREGRHYLKELRKERGLTQAQLAARAGCSQQFVSRIESNWVNAGPKTIRRLAPALEMDPLDLTLMEMIYRRTLGRVYGEPYDDPAKPVEELDVDRWTLEEAMDWARWFFYYDEEDYDGINSDEQADRVNAAMKRLRERYGRER